MANLQTIHSTLRIRAYSLPFGSVDIKSDSCETHYTTITTLFPANLPVSICLGVLLISLRDNATQKPVLLVMIGLISLIATVVSEYAVAASAASIALLLVLRRPRSAAAILAGASVGFLIFQNIASFNQTISRDASQQVEMFFHQPLHVASHFFRALWTSLIGSYGSAAAKIPLDSYTRSTVLSFTVAIFAGILIKKWFQQSNESYGEPRKLLGLFLATASGLLPVVYANEAPASGYSYATRFFIPVLPFAAITTVRGALHIVDQRFRPWLAAVLTFIAVCSVCNYAFDLWRQQKRMER